MGETVEVIPLIDMEEEVPAETLNQKIREACETWGCFRVKNHGVPPSLLSDMKETVRDLFERPDEVKRKITEIIPGSLYVTGNGIHHLNEAITLYDMASPQVVNAFCDQLEASPKQRETMLNYGKAIDDLAKYISGKLAESYGLQNDFFTGCPGQCRINKYHFTPEAVGRHGVDAHTDSGFVTILQEDDKVGGLEVMDPYSKTFVPVIPSPGTLLVNIGDIATIWSNGRLCSVKHRVICKEAAVRFSLASHPIGPLAIDKAVEPPSVFVDSEHPRLYVPISLEELRVVRAKKGHNGEVFDFIRCDTKDM